MAIDTERIFLLATKKSQRVENLTYCIGVHRLGTPNMEYILGEQTITVNIGKVMKFHIFIMRSMPIRCRRL